MNRYRITVTDAEGVVIETALYDAESWGDALTDAAQDARLMGALLDVDES